MPIITTNNGFLQKTANCLRWIVLLLLCRLQEYSSRIFNCCSMDTSIFDTRSHSHLHMFDLEYWDENHKNIPDRNNFNWLTMAHMARYGTKGPSIESFLSKIRQKLTDLETFFELLLFQEKFYEIFESPKKAGFWPKTIFFWYFWVIIMFSEGKPPKKILLWHGYRKLPHESLDSSEKCFSWYIFQLECLCSLLSSFIMILMFVTWCDEMWWLTGTWSQIIA